MINWTQMDVSIDNQAQLQLDHYFHDLEKILEAQHLSYKKDEVFKDLEDHIIDYIRNKQLVKISYNEALLILSELGPPDEYLDFSTMPSLVERLQDNGNDQDIDDLEDSDDLGYYIECGNCQTKNEGNSIFCMNCGEKFVFEEESRIDPLNHLFETKKIYLLNMVSVYFVVFMIFLSGFDLHGMNVVLKYLITILLCYEILLIPIVLFFSIVRHSQGTNYIFESFLGYDVKIISLYLPLLIYTFIFNFSGLDPYLFALICIISMVLMPFFVTKILFYSPYSKYLNKYLNTSVSKSEGQAIFLFVTIAMILFLGLEYEAYNPLNLNMVFFNLVLFEMLLTGLFMVGSLLIYIKDEKTTLSLSSYSFHNPYVFSESSRYFILENKNKLRINNFFFRVLIVVLWIFLPFAFSYTFNLSQLESSKSQPLLLAFALSFLTLITIELYFNIKGNLTNNFIFFTLGSMFLSVSLVFMPTLGDPSQNPLRFILPNIGSNHSLAVNYIELLSSSGLFMLIILSTYILLPALTIYLMFNSENAGFSYLSDLRSQIISYIIYLANIILFIYLLFAPHPITSETLLNYLIITGFLLVIRPILSFINYGFSKGSEQVLT